MVSIKKRNQTAGTGNLAKWPSMSLAYTQQRKTHPYLLQWKLQELPSWTDEFEDWILPIYIC